MANDKKIYFDTDTAPIISDILKKNQLPEETDSVILEKLSGDKPLYGEIIISTIEKICLDNSNEETVCSFLEKELATTNQAAKNIYSDIKEKLVPLAKQEASQKSVTEPQEIPSPKKQARKKILPPATEEIKKPTVTRSGPDNYREPIG